MELWNIQYKYRELIDLKENTMDKVKIINLMDMELLNRMMIIDLFQLNGNKEPLKIDLYFKRKIIMFVMLKKRMEKLTEKQLEYIKMVVESNRNIKMVKLMV